MRDSGLWRGVRTALMRAARPGAHPLEARLAGLARAIEAERPGAVWRGGLDGAAFLPDGSVDRAATARMREELRGWVRAVRGGHDLDRGGSLVGLARDLGPLTGSDSPDALVLWCEGRRAVELGGGPRPSLADAPFACITAVDPLADGYRAEGLVAPDGRMTFLTATPEAIPLAGGSADLGLAPARLPPPWRADRVAAEIARILAPGGAAALVRGDAPDGAPDAAVAEALRKAGLRSMPTGSAAGRVLIWRKD